MNSYESLEPNREDFLKQMGEYRRVETFEDWEIGLERLRIAVGVGLNCDNKIRLKTIDLIEEIKEDVNISNRLTLIVGIYYLASRLVGKPIKKRKFREEIGVSPITIKNVLPEILKHLQKNQRNKLREILDVA